MKLSIKNSWTVFFVFIVGVALGARQFGMESTPTQKVVVFDDRKTSSAKLAGTKWLKQGVYLSGAKPRLVSFSPDGRFLVGGARTPTIWNVRTGQVRGNFGNFEYIRINFLSNSKVAISHPHNINVYGLDFKEKHRVLKRIPYRGISFPATLKAKGVWVYAPDIYAAYTVTTASRTKYRLRFLDMEHGQFTRNLPISLTEEGVHHPLFVVDRGSWMGVFQRGLRMFVLDKNYKVVWQEQLAFEYNEDDPDYTPPNPNPLGHSHIYDFDLVDSDLLLLLDRDKGLRSINLKTGVEAKPYPLPERPTKLAVSKGGDLWAFGDKSGRLMLVEANTRELLANVVLPFTTEYLTFSPDEKSIAVGGLVILPIPTR